MFENNFCKNEIEIEIKELKVLSPTENCVPIRNLIPSLLSKVIRLIPPKIEQNNYSVILAIKIIGLRRTQQTTVNNTDAYFLLWKVMQKCKEKKRECMQIFCCSLIKFYLSMI